MTAAGDFSDRTALAEALRALPKSEIKRFWADLGYILLPAAPEWHDRPATDLQRGRLLAATTEALVADIAACPDLAVMAGLGPAIHDLKRAQEVMDTRPKGGHDEDTDSGILAAIVRDFYDLIVRTPVNAKKGGNGFNGCLQVYAVARLLKPKAIIESGVFRGQTTWILRQACPHATIFCFDVDFSNLVYKDRDAIYTQADWSEFDLSGLPAGETLAFFDDHIDQGRRVLEAQARGITRLLFDDNASAARIHTVGGPPVPSLDMLMDPALDGQDLAWTYRGKRYGCHVDAAAGRAVRKAVDRMWNFADMHSVTGYTPARITYVSLASGAGGI